MYFLDFNFVLSFFKFVKIDKLKKKLIGCWCSIILLTMSVFWVPEMDGVFQNKD